MTTEHLTKETWVTDGVPNFCDFGYHTGRKIQFRLDDGTEITDIYQGYGIFGRGAGFDWKQSATPSTARVVIGWRPA